MVASKGSASSFNVFASNLKISLDSIAVDLHVTSVLLTFQRGVSPWAANASRPLTTANRGRAASSKSGSLPKIDLELALQSWRSSIISEMLLLFNPMIRFSSLLLMRASNATKLSITVGSAALLSLVFLSILTKVCGCTSVGGSSLVASFSMSLALSLLVIAVLFGARQCKQSGCSKHSFALPNRCLSHL